MSEKRQSTYWGLSVVLFFSVGAFKLYADHLNFCNRWIVSTLANLKTDPTHDIDDRQLIQCETKGLHMSNISQTNVFLLDSTYHFTLRHPPRLLNVHVLCKREDRHHCFYQRVAPALRAGFGTDNRCIAKRGRGLHPLEWEEEKWIR